MDINERKDASTGKRGVESEHIGAGDTVRVRIEGGRRAPRTAVVIDIRACESLSGGEILLGRWEDDGTPAWIVPGADVELIVKNEAAVGATS